MSRRAKHGDGERTSQEIEHTWLVSLEESFAAGFLGRKRCSIYPYFYATPLFELVFLKFAARGLSIEIALVIT